MLLKCFGVFLIFIGVGIFITGFRVNGSEEYQAYVTNSKRYHTYTELDREKLITLYHLNPDRWTFEFESHASDYSTGHKLVYWGETSPVHIILNEKDFKWLLKEYKEYNKRKKEKKETAKQTDALKEIITTSQKDIDSMRQKATNDFNAVMKQTERIQLNLETGLKCGPHNKEGLYGPPEDPKKADLTIDTYGF